MSNEHQITFRDNRNRGAGEAVRLPWFGLAEFLPFLRGPSPDASGRRAGREPTSRSRGFRPIKLVLSAALLLAIIGFMLAPFVFPRSTEAITNAPLVSIRATISGRVSLGSVVLGALVRKGDDVGHILNPILTKTFLMELENDRVSLLAMIKSQDEQIAQLTDSQASFARVLGQSHESLIARSRSLLKEQVLRVKLLESRHVRHVQERDRLVQLAARNEASNRDVEAAIQAVTMSELEVELERERASHAALQVEAVERELVLENNSSLTIARVHFDGMQVKLGALTSERLAAVQKLHQIEAAARREGERIDLAARSPLVAPVSGRVWQVQTATDTFVKEGDEIFAIANCEAPMVTATVSETTFNGIAVGQRVIFTPEGEQTRLPYRIIEARGPASGSSLISYAIQPFSKATREFQIVARFQGDERAGPQACNLGRTGKLMFEPRGPGWITHLFRTSFEMSP